MCVVYSHGHAYAKIRIRSFFLILFFFMSVVNLSSFDWW